MKFNIFAKEAQQLETSLLEKGLDEDEVNNLLDWSPKIAEETNFNGSREIVIKGSSCDVKEKVESNLSEIAKKLKTSLTNRMKHLQVVEESVSAFSINKCLELTKAENFMDEARSRLCRVFDSANANGLGFTFEECLSGYVMFLKFIKKKLICIPLEELDGIALEDVYLMFYTEFKDVEVATPFVKLFQHIQVKSYSEAMCETVGSIMKIHGGQGRNLHPANFSKEIFLKLNLPLAYHKAKTDSRSGQRSCFE